MFILVKDLIQIIEMQVYSEDYPKIIKGQLLTKTLITSLIVLIQGYFVLKKKKFNGCKFLYAFKLL